MFGKRNPPVIPHSPVLKGGVIPVTNTSGAYTLPDSFSGGQAMWVSNSGAGTMSIYIPNAAAGTASFVGGVTSITVQTSHVVNFVNIGGSFIQVRDFTC